MIDLNTLLNAALQQALESLLRPYEERIAALEKAVEALKDNNLSEDSMRKLAEEVCEWKLDGHMDEFDHQPLSDFHVAIREEVELAVASLYGRSLKLQVEQILSEAAVTINVT